MLFADATATKITMYQLDDMLEKWEECPSDNDVPRKQFWAYDEVSEDYFVVDNRCGNFFIEQFSNPEPAHAWLRGMGIAEANELDEFLLENLVPNHPLRSKYNYNYN